eukprot:753888-Hanusia_phi.AAC.4
MRKEERRGEERRGEERDEGGGEKRGRGRGGERTFSVLTGRQRERTWRSPRWMMSMGAAAIRRVCWGRGGQQRMGWRGCTIMSTS